LPENKSSKPNLPQERWPNCPECERLWNAYALGTRLYLDAILAEGAAAQGDNVEKVKVLEEEALERAHWREFARKVVRDHAASHAVKKPETQESGGVSEC
jgi:hypothetical protein